MGLNGFHIKWIIGTHWIKKMKILGAVLELPAKQHCWFGQFGQNGLDWQCCLAGNSKTAPRILIFSMAMGADYSFYVKTIETHAWAFLTLNILAIGRVYWILWTKLVYEQNWSKLYFCALSLYSILHGSNALFCKAGKNMSLDSNFSPNIDWRLAC